MSESEAEIGTAVFPDDDFVIVDVYERETGVVSKNGSLGARGRFARIGVSCSVRRARTGDLEYKGWDCDRECMGEDGRYSGELMVDDVEVRLEGISSNPRTWK